MEESSQDERGRSESPQGGFRREKGKKRTQINMTGYKGLKEEFMNALTQSVVKDGQGELSQQNASTIQQNEQSLINDHQDQEIDLLTGSKIKKTSTFVDKVLDQQVPVLNSFDSIPPSNPPLNQGSTISGKKKVPSFKTNTNISLKRNPYQGQDILDKMYFNYSKIYENKNIKDMEETTNLPLVMKLKDISTKLVNSLQSRREKVLNQQAYNLLNDMSILTDNSDVIKKRDILNITKSTLYNYFQYIFTKNWCVRAWNSLFSHIPVLLPSNTYKFLWDLLQLIVIVSCIIFVPIVFVFNLKFNELMPPILSWFIPILLSIDIPINMNTGLYEKGHLILQRKLIIISYLRNNYIKDILSILPIIIHFLKNEIDEVSIKRKQGEYQLSDIFIFLILFKIPHMSRIIHRIEERYHLSPRSMNIVSLIKLLFTILFVAHIFCSIWVLVAFLETAYTSDSSWLQFYNLNTSEWYNQYIRSYYFVMVTMITVGYGDTLPTNDPEMILCVFTMLISCGVFGYSLNSIGMILLDFSSREKEIKDDFFTINNYMDQKNVNQDLQYKIRQYLDYYWREMKNSNIEKEQKIIFQLSELLRDELLLEANKFILKESPIFSSNFTDFSIMRTVKLIQEYRCAPKEIICFEDQQDDCSIYFIEKGEIDIFIDSISDNNSSANSNGLASQSKMKTLQSLKKGDHFGGVSFFTGQPRKYSICSKEFTTLLMIKRQDFIKLLMDESPEDYEMFCAIKDNILNYNNYSQLNIKCFSCNSEFHLMGECPLIHYNANKDLIIRKLQYSPPQKCDRSALRRKTTSKALFKLKYIQERIAKFCDDDDNEQCLDQYEAFFGICSQSSQSSQNSESEQQEQNKKMRQSAALSAMSGVSQTSINKRNSMKSPQRNDLAPDEVQSENSNIYYQNDGAGFIYSQKFQNQNYMKNQSNGSTGKISQKNIPSSENVLEESDYTKVLKIGEHLLYGSDAGLQNTHTQIAKSFKTWEDKGNLSYQKSSSFVSKYQSKINSNTLFQLSIGSAGSANQFMNINGISDLSEQVMNDQRSRKSLMFNKNSTPSRSQQSSNARSDYEVINNEMRYIDDGSIQQNTVIQYQMINEKLGKFALDVQLNQYLSEEQKLEQIATINGLLDNLRVVQEPERLGPQMYKMSEGRKPSTSQQVKYNVLKIEKLFNSLFTEKNADTKSDQISNLYPIQEENDGRGFKKDEKSRKKEIQKEEAEEIEKKESKKKISEIIIEFDLKKSYLQYFPHNNCERVILIANMNQSERRKKLNKLMINRKVGKVERKGAKNSTRVFGNHSKFNKLLNTFQNQTEGEDDASGDNLSQSRKSNIYKRKLSLFGQEKQHHLHQNDKKSVDSNSSSKSEKHKPESRKSEQSELKINSKLSPKLLQESLSYQKIDSGVNQESMKDFEFKLEQVEDSIKDVNEREENTKQQEIKNINNNSNNKKRDSNSKERSHTQNNGNFLVFQRAMNKKKLSEIQEQDCGSSLHDTNSQMMISNSKNNHPASIQKDLTDSSIEQNNSGNAFSRQESMNMMFGNKRPSSFFNQELQNFQQAQQQQHQQSQSHDSYQQLGEKSYSSKNLTGGNQPKSSKKLSNLFENNEQWLVGQGKDEGINPIYSMNIDLGDVKKYHQWESKDKHDQY